MQPDARAPLLHVFGRLPSQLKKPVDSLLRQGFDGTATPQNHLAGQFEKLSVLYGMGVVGRDRHQPVMAHDHHIVVLHGHGHRRHHQQPKDQP